MGTSKLASRSEQGPTKKDRTPLWGALGESNSQKRARTSADSTRSKDFSMPADIKATSRTHEKNSPYHRGSAARSRILAGRGSESAARQQSGNPSEGRDQRSKWIVKTPFPHRQSPTNP